MTEMDIGCHELRAHEDPPDDGNGSFEGHAHALLTLGLHKQVVRNQATQGSSEKFHVDVALVRILCHKHTGSGQSYIPVGAVDEDIVAPSNLQERT